MSRPTRWVGARTGGFIWSLVGAFTPALNYLLVKISNINVDEGCVERRKEVRCGLWSMTKTIRLRIAVETLGNNPCGTSKRTPHSPSPTRFSGEKPICTKLMLEYYTKAIKQRQNSTAPGADCKTQ